MPRFRVTSRRVYRSRTRPFLNDIRAILNLLDHGKVFLAAKLERKMRYGRPQHLTECCLLVRFAQLVEFHGHHVYVFMLRSIVRHIDLTTAKDAAEQALVEFLAQVL